MNLRDLENVLHVPHTHASPSNLGDSDCLACVLSETFTIMGSILALDYGRRAELLDHVQRVIEERRHEVQPMIEGPSGTH